MRKVILFVGTLFLLASCSNQSKKPMQSQTPSSEKPPQAISCKDYCKDQCQGLQSSCESNCLNACYPTP